MGVSRGGVHRSVGCIRCQTLCKALRGVRCIDLKGNNLNNCMVWMQVSGWRLLRLLLRLVTLRRRIFWHDFRYDFRYDFRWYGTLLASALPPSVHYFFKKDCQPHQHEVCLWYTATTFSPPPYSPGLPVCRHNAVRSGKVIPHQPTCRFKSRGARKPPGIHGPPRGLCNARLHHRRYVF